MGRAPCCDKIGLKRGRWTAEEDEILKKYIQANGEGSWRALPKNAGLLRCGKSCRLRWINYLRADLKRGNITAEEEDTIVKLHKSFGNRWSVIASHLAGRTDNEIKNYWNSHLRRTIYTFRPSNESIPTSINTTKMVTPSKQRGGRVSRSVAKKYNTNSPLNVTMSRTKPKGYAKNGVPESTATEKALPPGPIIEINEGRERKCMGSNERSIDVQRCCRENEVLCPRDKMDKETEVLGPYEELDDQIMDLNYILWFGSSSGIVSLNEWRERTITGNTDNVASFDYEREHGVWSTNCEIGESYAFSSPMNSCFDGDWVEWDWEGVVIEEGFQLCDGEDMLLWPWDSGNYEVGESDKY